MRLKQRPAPIKDDNRLPPHSDGVNLCLSELLEYKNKSVHWLPPARNVWAQLSGRHQSRMRGRGMDFSEVRPYQAGDDIRAIDWRVTARTGKPHTKLYSEEREQPVMLLVDLGASMAFGSQLLLKSVQAAHFASLLAWIAVKGNDRIGAVITNGIAIKECKPTGRQQGPLLLINSLIESHQQLLSASSQSPLPVSAETADVKPAQGDGGFSGALQHLHRLCPKGSDIVIISDFYALSPEDKQPLGKLRQHNHVQFVQISDPLEQGQTQYRGQEYVSDGSRSTWLDFSSTKTRDSLANQYRQHQEFVESLAKSLAIPLHTVSAAIPLPDQLGAPTR